MTDTEPTPAPVPVGRDSIRSLIAMAVTLVVLGVATYQIWSRVRPGKSTLHRTPLTAERIRTSEPPQWVKSNVASEVVVQGSLGDHDLSEPGLVRVVHQAFTNHPWVKKVKYVAIESGSEVNVELEYRQPLAVVVVPAELLSMVKMDAEYGLVPIDDKGVCLPDVSETQANSMPRIYADSAVPPHGIGQCWSDVRVKQAAAIIARLSQVWDALQLYAVHAPTPSAASDQTAFVLQTKNQQRIVWGSAPEAELRGEPKVGDKIALLVQLAPTLHANSTPSTGSGDVLLDLSLPRSQESSARRGLGSGRIR